MKWLSRLLREKAGPRPRLTMREVAAELLSGPTESTSEHNRWVINSIHQRFSQPAIDELKNRLLATEKRSLNSSSPVRVLRVAIMDAVDASSLNAAVLEFNEDQQAAIRSKHENFSGEKLLGVYLDAEFETMCLRLYSFALYGDGGHQDWFSVYVDGAQEFGKHMARVMLADSGDYDGDSAVLATMHDPFLRGKETLRERLLESPVGFVFSDSQA